MSRSEPRSGASDAIRWTLVLELVGGGDLYDILIAKITAAEEAAATMLDEPPPQVPNGHSFALFLSSTN